MPCSAEWTPTLFTVIVCLSTVGEQMLGKAWFCDWREVAPFVLIWFFWGMCLDVTSKSACLWTRTLWAFVWFLPTLFISYDLCICMIDALPLFCKSRLGGECDLCCFFYGYSQPCYSLLEASSINKLVHSLDDAFLSVQPDQMNNSEHSCTFSQVWMITDNVAL